MNEALATQVTEPELRCLALVLISLAYWCVPIIQALEKEPSGSLRPVNLVKSVIYRLRERRWLKDIHQLLRT